MKHESILTHEYVHTYNFHSYDTEFLEFDLYQSGYETGACGIISFDT
jgi:predicted metalloprotease with PDZ domain